MPDTEPTAEAERPSFDNLGEVLPESESVVAEKTAEHFTRAQNTINEAVRTLQFTRVRESIIGLKQQIQRSIQAFDENRKLANLGQQADRYAEEIRVEYAIATRLLEMIVAKLNYFELPDTFDIPDRRIRDIETWRTQLATDTRRCTDSTALAVIIEAAFNSIGTRPELAPDAKSALEQHIIEHIRENSDTETNVQANIAGYRNAIIDGKLFDHKQETYKLTIGEFVELTDAEQQAIIDAQHEPAVASRYINAANTRALPIKLNALYQSECVLSPEDATNLSIDISPIIADPTTNPDSADILLKSRRAHEADIRTRTRADMLRRQLDEFNTSMRTAGDARAATELLENPDAYDAFINRAEVMNPPSAAQIEQIKNELATGFNTDTLTFKQDFIDSHSQDPAELRSEFLTRHAELRRLCTPPDAPLNLKRDREISNKIKKLQEICKAYHESKYYFNAIEQARERLANNILANAEKTKKDYEEICVADMEKPDEKKRLKEEAVIKAKKTAQDCWSSNDSDKITSYIENLTQQLDNLRQSQMINYELVTESVLTNDNINIESNSTELRLKTRRVFSLDIELTELKKFNYSTKELQGVFIKKPEEAAVLFTNSTPRNTLLLKKQKELADKLKDKKHPDYKNKDDNDKKGSEKRALDSAALEYIKTINGTIPGATPDADREPEPYWKKLYYDNENTFTVEKSLKDDVLKKTQKIQEDIFKNISDPTKRYSSMMEGLTYLDDGNQQFLTSGGEVNKKYVHDLLVRRYFVDFIRENESMLFEGVNPLFLDGDGKRKGIKSYITQQYKDKTYIKKSEFSENLSMQSILDKDKPEEKTQIESMQIEQSANKHDVIISKMDKIRDRIGDGFGLESTIGKQVLDSIKPLTLLYNNMSTNALQSQIDHPDDYVKQVIGDIYIPTRTGVRSADGKNFVDTNRTESVKVTFREFQQNVSEQISAYLDLANQYIDTCMELAKKHGRDSNAFKIFTREVPKLLFPTQPNPIEGGLPIPILFNKNDLKSLTGLLRDEIKKTYNKNKKLRSYRVLTEQRDKTIKIRANYNQSSNKLEEKIIHHYPLDPLHAHIIIKGMIREHIIGLPITERFGNMFRKKNKGSKPKAQIVPIEDEEYQPEFQMAA